MRLTHALLSLALVVVAARLSSAQETGHVGLTMAFPAAVGVIWQTTDHLAIRPDFTFSHQEAGSAPVASSNTTGVGVSALFYVRKWDNLRAYLSPRFGYQHVSYDLPGATSGSTMSDQYSFAGSFGAEYQLHRRFAVFAETGLIYTHSSLDFGSTIAGVSPGSTSNSWGTRAGVGAILYF
jgi:hypothetical protein